ncbi:MAG: hypothetical protein J5W83_02335, partial [Candidatus Accumulibacter sp.]|uniref:hypothetical protein n=1 Tax=Accumulibacter sp. TaxID=2053492 RepID=UPI001B040AC1
MSSPAPNTRAPTNQQSTFGLGGSGEVVTADAAAPERRAARALLILASRAKAVTVQAKSMTQRAARMRTTVGIAIVSIATIVVTPSLSA